MLHECIPGYYQILIGLSMTTSIDFYFEWPNIFLGIQSAADLPPNCPWYALPNQYAIYSSGFSCQKLPRFQGFDCQNIRLWTLQGLVRVRLLHGTWHKNLKKSSFWGIVFFSFFFKSRWVSTGCCQFVGWLPRQSSIRLNELASFLPLQTFGLLVWSFGKFLH